jgi:hypothetical protein
MNKKGKMYIVMICFLGIGLLIASYVRMIDHYGQHQELRVTESIGSKQQAIMHAVYEGERMQLYMYDAARLALGAATEKPQCGAPYLGYSKIGRDSCEVAQPEDMFNGQFNTYLALYPAGSLTTADQVIIYCVDCCSNEAHSCWFNKRICWWHF